MRRLILLGLMAVLVLPAGAAKRVTVEQLEQAIATDSAAHRADTEVARQIGEFELSERLTGATLDRFAARLPLGPRTALALQLLADQSAFLDPPASEMPATALPDAAMQQRMMDAARGYVAQTLPHLPNFFATRTTNRFDDSPQVMAKGDWPVRAGLHLVGTTNREITFRDGKEVQEQQQKQASSSAQKAQQELGLSTWGEFGPELSIVLADAAKGTVTFSHWEQTPAGLAAVYKYAVPRAASHYAVSYCCVSDAPVVMGRQGGGRRGGSSQMPTLSPTSFKPFTETPGYHGTLSVNPATGGILRITLEAELSSSDPLLRAATVVEYGPVTIGERSFICPVRSLAFSMEEAKMNGGAGGNTLAASTAAAQAAWSNPASRSDRSPLLLVNETSFTHYHRLGATMRMLADAAEPGAASPPSQNAAEQPFGAPGSAASNAGPRSAPPLAAIGQPAAPVETAASHAAPVPPAPQPSAPAQPFVPEISLTAANGVPDEPANAPQAQEGGVTLRVTSRLVDVGIVAYDKKGHPVKDLKAEDFEIYDNGRKQEVRSFSQYVSEATAVPAVAAAPEHSFTNRPSGAAAAGPAAPAAESGATILLIDESHIAWGDLSNARQQMLKFLAELAPGERVGLYTMTGIGFRVLTEITADHAALMARLQKWMPTAQSAANAQEEETRNRQQFNEVHSVSDLNSVNGNRVDSPDGDSPVDPQLRALGSNPARASLVILGGVARHLSGVSGHKNLVWVSSDNVFAEWEDQAVGTDKGFKSLDSFALRAQEAMNEAHVAVFPFDISQLESAAINADIQHRNVELTQAAQDTASLGGGAVARNMTPGRISAQMSQDLHPIQGPIRQVAEATGGRTIRRGGELAAALEGIVEDGHATYLLSFSPQGQADGEYHTITVKLTGKHGLMLRYRTGYLFSKEPSTLKERFQQAVWRPRDASEISILADVDRSSAGATVKVNIAAGDLGLRQQDGRWMDKVDIFFIQRDDAGLRAQVQGQILGLKLKSSTYQNLLPAGIPFEHFVQLKPGMASLRVLVVDENSGRMGSVTMPASALEAGQ
jgi:VWFA-related protein